MGHAAVTLAAFLKCYRDKLGPGRTKTLVQSTDMAVDPPLTRPWNLSISFSSDMKR